MRSTAGKMLLLVVSCLGSLLAAEGALRLSGRVRVRPVVLASERPELYEAYPPYGYRLKPSRVTTYQYPRVNPRTLTVSANSHGFRERRELVDADSRPRLLVLGDSFVFGEGVEEPERFASRLETLAPDWRIDNLGMVGFGPDLMLRALEQVGLALHPKAMLVVMYTDDFRRVRPEYAGAGFAVPRYMLRGGQLETVEYPALRFWSRWHLVAATREVLWRTSRAEWALNAAILDRMREVATRERIALGLVFLPGTSDTPTDQERRHWLATYAAAHQTPYIDLTGPVLSNRERALFIPGNFHLNPDGHAVVAEALVPFVRASLQ